MEEFFEFWSFTLCREHNVEAQTSKSTQMKIKKENSKLHEKKKEKEKRRQRSFTSCKCYLKKEKKIIVNCDANAGKNIPYESLKVKRESRNGFFYLSFFLSLKGLVLL